MFRNMALNGSTALQHFNEVMQSKYGNEIMFDFYLGLPHIDVWECGNTTVYIHINIVQKIFED